MTSSSAASGARARVSGVGVGVHDSCARSKAKSRASKESQYIFALPRFQAIRNFGLNGNTFP